jgi:hypothetical protein
MITFIWHTSNDALPHDLTGRRQFLRHVRTHLTAHNNKLKLLGSSYLPLGDKYFNVKETMRQYFLVFFMAFRFVYLILMLYLAAIRASFSTASGAFSAPTTAMFAKK